MSDGQQHQIHQIILRQIRLLRSGWYILLGIFLLTVGFMVMTLQISHRNDTQAWSRLFLTQMQNYSRTARQSLAEAAQEADTVVRLDETGQIVASSDNSLVGFNLTNSGIFRKIYDMSPGDEYLLLDSGLTENRLKSYFIVREEEHYTLLIFNPEEFFPLVSSNTFFLFLDESHVVIYSSHREFMGAMVSPHRVFYRRGRGYIGQRILIHNTGRESLYLIRDISTQFFLVLAAGFFFAVLLIILRRQLGQTAKQLNLLESESQGVNNMVDRLKPIDMHWFQQVENPLKSYKVILEDFLEASRGKNLTFLENERSLSRLRELAESVLLMLDRTDAMVLEIREAETRYRSIFDNIQTGIFQSDNRSYVLTINQAMAELFGCSSAEIVLDYVNYKDYHPFEDPKDYQSYMELLSKNGFVDQFRTTFLSPCDEPIYVSLSSRKIYNEEGKFLYVQGSVQDISAEKEAQTLKKEKDRIEALSKAKSDFLANISHELRTPLNSVIGFSELLLGNLQDRKNKAYVESISTAGKSLLTIITDILDLSKIDSGKMELNLAPLDLRRLLQEVDQIFSLRVSQKGLRLFLDIPEDFPPALLMDETRLRQILLNLVGNAVKFTHRGSITLGLEWQESPDPQRADLSIRVSDTGQGMDSTAMNHIFEEFFQQTSGHGGTGLGLPICKRLTEMMGGEISVTSVPSKGSEFLLHFSALERAELKKAHHEAQQARHVRFKGSPVLVADDSEPILDFVTDALSLLNLRVFRAENGQQALEIMKELEPQAVLLDIKMPVLDGWKTLERIREIPAYKDLPVIAFTASSKTDRAEDFLERGFSGFLSKPVQTIDLVKELCRFLDYDELDIPEEQEESLLTSGPRDLPQELKDELTAIWPDLSREGTVLKMSTLKQIIDLMEGRKDQNSSWGFSQAVERLKTLKENFDFGALEKYLKELARTYGLVEEQDNG